MEYTESKNNEYLIKVDDDEIKNVQRFLLSEDKQMLANYLINNFMTKKTYSYDKLESDSSTNKYKKNFKELVEDFKAFRRRTKKENKELLEEKQVIANNKLLKEKKEKTSISTPIVQVNSNKEEIEKKDNTSTTLTGNPVNNINNTEKKASKIEKGLDFNKTKHLAFKFMYIGKNYEGLITQSSTKNTIEEKILNAFLKAKLIKDYDTCSYSRCGRTDKGVSAFGNVFDLQVRYVEKYDYISIINRMLPNDIRIVGVAEVGDDFNSRFSCVYREYKYFFIKRNLDINLIKDAAKKLEGEHNFYNFCKVDRSKVDENGNSLINFTRTIFDISIHKYDSENINLKDKNCSTNLTEFYDIYYCRVRGSAFLWHQIRCIMSILFAVGSKMEDPSIIETLLNETSYHYNYGIADDGPLILSDCHYEGVEFKPALSQEGNNMTFFCLSELVEDAVIDLSVKSFVLSEYSKIIESTLSSVEKKNNNNLELIEKKDDDNSDKIIEKCVNKLTKDFPNLRNPVKYTPLLKRKRENTDN